MPQTATIKSLPEVLRNYANQRQADVRSVEIPRPARPATRRWRGISNGITYNALREYNHL